ncbi:MAG TPA: TetR/AcrR family transcriptional regulator [Caulobacteraceae bacterium]|jgi:AcrR family transcriptional regulator|nr:TetR/AcrR family transcriptional regulator [Caulobacteraceae bacterium]
MTSSRTATPRRYHKGNVAEDLKTVALRILETERVEDVSVRRLTREVGVTAANFYNHFAGLNDLLLDIAADAMDERMRLSAHIQRTSRSRADAIRRSATTFVEFAIDHRELFRIMFGYIPDSLENARFRTASDAAFGRLAEMVYGQPIDDAANWEVSREKYKGAYGCFAMSYGLARIMVERQVPFSGDRRAEMLSFVEGVVDTYIRGELADLVGE